MTALFLFAAPSALASKVTSFPGGLVTVTAVTGETNNIVISNPGGGTATVTDTAGVQPMGGSGCVQGDAMTVVCTTGNWGSVDVSAGDGDDSVKLSLSLGSPGSLQVSGGAGNDMIDAASVAGGGSLVGTIQLAGFAGNDTVIGSPASDSIDSMGQAGPPGSPAPDGLPDDGDDRLLGGDGNDTIHPGRGADVADGGGGDDSMHSVLAVNGTGVDDGGLDVITCGTGNDNADLGVGDQVDSDCELIGQLVACPGGATCEVAPSITAPGGATAASGFGAAAAKKGKAKTRLLGVGRKTKIGPGQTSGVTIRMRSKQVNAALGKRASITATFLAAITRTKKGKEVGKIKRKRRFKLNR